MRIVVILLTLVLSISVAGLIFINLPRFGSNSKGERLERIKKSPNYKFGMFRNREHTQLITSDQSRFGTMWNFLFGKKERVKPFNPVDAVKTNLKTLPDNRNWIVWFGHSSYLMNINGKKFLVDPVFYAASPVSFVNKPFEGTSIYKPSDLPDIDYYITTHDHWDHLDAQTVEELNSRVRFFVCPLGVGEHLERWGVSPDKLIEQDWDESFEPENGIRINCLPARHFSGRGLSSNKTLWASYMLETPCGKIFIGGDGGYGQHFKEIGERFKKIDLAILENGQYDNDWAQIHTLPHQLKQVAADLNPKEIITVHHSKFALAKHPWDEPLATEKRLNKEQGFNVTIPSIGKPVYLKLN